MVTIKFDQEIKTLTGGSINMGVIEVIKREAASKVRMEERAKAKAKSHEIAIKMKQSGFDPEMISDMLGLPLAEIEEL